VISDILRLIVIGLILLFIEIGAGPLLDINGARPDLLLIFVITISIRRGRIAGLAAGFLTGLMQDVTTLGYLGIYAFAKSSLGFWAGWWLERNQSPLRTWMWLPLVMCCALIQNVIYGLFILQGTEFHFWGYFLSRIIPVIVYTGLLGYLWALMPMATGHRSQIKPVRMKLRKS